jgi:hypothetical protein
MEFPEYQIAAHYSLEGLYADLAEVGFARCIAHIIQDTSKRHTVLGGRPTKSTEFFLVFRITKLMAKLTNS